MRFVDAVRIDKQEFVIWSPERRYNGQAFRGILFAEDGVDVEPGQFNCAILGRHCRIPSE